MSFVLDGPKELLSIRIACLKTSFHLISLLIFDRLLNTKTV